MNTLALVSTNVLALVSTNVLGAASATAAPGRDSQHSVHHGHQPKTSSRIGAK